MNLLHLVSEQTVQNLLPILALRPENVIQVRSSEERFIKAASNLNIAVSALDSAGRLLFPMPKFFDWEINKASPTADQTRRKVGEALSLWPGCVVNLTGGTKQMSIGAFLAAEYQGEASLYCDSQAGIFLEVSEKYRLPSVPPIREAANLLTVESLLAAHGIDPAQIKSSLPLVRELAFGNSVDAVYCEDKDGINALLSSIRNQLHPGGKLAKKSGIDAIFALGLPEPTLATHRAFYEAAVKAGYLQEQNGKYFYLLGEDVRGSDSRLRKTLKISRALVGGWFELLVYDRMFSSGRFSDLRTEVQSQKNSQSLGETDILAIDLTRPGLVFVSCKLSDEFLQKPLEHVFATRQRAVEFGGTFAQAILCIRDFVIPGRRKTIEEACQVAGVRLVDPLLDL